MNNAAVIPEQTKLDALGWSDKNVGNHKALMEALPWTMEGFLKMKELNFLFSAFHHLLAWREKDDHHRSSAPFSSKVNSKQGSSHMCVYVYL